MASINYGKMTSVIADKLYPFVEAHLVKRERQYKAVIADFMNKNHDILYEVAPYDNIFFTKTDILKFFMALDIKESEVKAITNECYFAHKPVNPPVVKVPYAQVLVCILMYYLRHKKQKEAEITLLYMAFSGKFYASIFGKYFKTAPPSKYRSTMDYVVNNMLNDRFDLRSKGNLFGAIRSMCISLIEMYGDTLVGHPDDEEIKYFMQQLRDRENTFMNRIFNLYITAWQDKKYLNYESDNLEDGSEFRISDSDATIAARITENALNYILNNTVSLKICNMFNDANIRPTELRDIIEAIVNDRKNINQLQRVINILICDFMKKNPNKRVGDVDFLGYCLKEQPNTKDEYIIEMQSIIVSWLDDKSPNYRRRKSRKATEISYRKAIKFYITMVIANVANKTR